MANVAEQFIEVGAKITEDTPLFRVFSSYRLRELLVSKKLTLVAPELWDDPYENFLARAKATVDGAPNVSLGGLFKNFYGQCWTLNAESDAMWRIYSQTKDGARVRSTVGRVIRAIYNHSDPFATMSYFIGAVAYKTEAEIRQHFADPGNATRATLDSSGRGQAATLFIKREEFRHEAEVRLLYVFHKDGSSEQNPAKVQQFPINPNDVFDDIIFDPRMDDAAFQTERSVIRALGFKKDVDRSKLYQVPDLRVTIRTH